MALVVRELAVGQSGVDGQAVADEEQDRLAAIRARRPDADFAALVREGVVAERHQGDRRRAA